MPSLFSSTKAFSKKSSENDKKLSPNSSSSTQTNVTAELLYKYGYAGGVSVPVIPDMSKKLSKNTSEKNEKKESKSSLVKKQLPVSQNKPALNTADLLYKYGFGNSPVPVIVAPRCSLKDKSSKKAQELSNDKPATTKVFSPPELVVTPKLGRI